MNEILASDYLIPMRLLAPAKAQESGAGFMESGVTDMADWNRQMQGVVAQHRRDPASMHTLPFPVQYQIIGGEGKDLVPGELLAHGEDMQLNAMGIPAQFYRGDLTIQTAPMAARLFESHWQHIPSAANSVLRWVVEKITPHLGWKEFGVRLTPPKIADNIDQLMLLLQMMQAGEVTATTILSKLGLDRSEELRRKGDETIQSAKMEAKINPEMDKIVSGNTALQQAVEQQRAMMAGGGAPQGGAAAPPADPTAQIMERIESFGNPQAPTSPVEMQQVAQEAAAIFAFMPEVEKRAKLREVEQINPVMADLIRKEMEEVHKQKNRDFIMQGEAAMQQGGAPPGEAPPPM
jgi:hypothetical protein